MAFLKLPNYMQFLFRINPIVDTDGVVLDLPVDDDLSIYSGDVDYIDYPMKSMVELVQINNVTTLRESSTDTFSSVDAPILDTPPETPESPDPKNDDPAPILVNQPHPLETTSLSEGSDTGVTPMLDGHIDILESRPRIFQMSIDSLDTTDSIPRGCATCEGVTSDSFDDLDIIIDEEELPTVEVAPNNTTLMATPRVSHETNKDLLHATGESLDDSEISLEQIPTPRAVVKRRESRLSEASNSSSSSSSASEYSLHQEKQTINLSDENCSVCSEHDLQESITKLKKLTSDLHASQDSIPRMKTLSQCSSSSQTDSESLEKTVKPKDVELLMSLVASDDDDDDLKGVKAPSAKNVKTKKHSASSSSSSEIVPRISSPDNKIPVSASSSSEIIPQKWQEVLKPRVSSSTSSASSSTSSSSRYSVDETKAKRKSEEPLKDMRKHSTTSVSSEEVMIECIDRIGDIPEPIPSKFDETAFVISNELDETKLQTSSHSSKERDSKYIN